MPDMRPSPQSEFRAAVVGVCLVVAVLIVGYQLVSKTSSFSRHLAAKARFADCILAIPKDRAITEADMERCSK